MPKIDFYILPDKELTGCLRAVCRVVEKAYKKRHRIYIHTDDQAMAHQMDELLWTYQEDSFLPHNLLGEGPDKAPPIQIGFGVTPENHRDILINLSMEVPTFHTQFNRILEFVTQENAQQVASREHYKLYRSFGFDINTHKLQTVEI